MDLDALADWSRYVVAAAVFTYLAGWLVFIAEAGLHSRLRRESSQVSVVTPELVTVGGTAAGDSAGHGGALDQSRADSTANITRRADEMGRWGRTLVVIGTAVLAVGIAMRSVGAERVPWGNMYEFSITGVLVGSIAFLLLARTPTGRAIAVWVVFILFVVLGVAVTALYVPPGPLVPALRHYWLIVHVGAAVVAFGLFTVSAVISGLQIVSERAKRRGAAGGFGASLPPASSLDRLAYRLTAIAFPVWTLGPLILGSIWAEVSWGRYWGWDPKEVWALITWLVYASYLHARATAGWKGSKASVIALIGYTTVLFSYFGVNIFFSGLHSYGGL